MRYVAVLAAIGLVPAIAGQAGATAFNGTDDNQIDAYGYYYAVSGGKFPTGSTPNGDNASGGTYRFVTDSDYWSAVYCISKGVWYKDDWYADNAGLALTLKNGAVTVYDNNGLEDGSFPVNHYNGPLGGHGAVVAYSMSNNFDWVYAGRSEERRVGKECSC